MGQSYNFSVGKLFRKNSVMPMKDGELNLLNKSDGFFCSELIASAFKQMTLLEPKLSSAQFWPGNIEFFIFHVK